MRSVAARVDLGDDQPDGAGAHVQHGNELWSRWGHPWGDNAVDWVPDTARLERKSIRPM